MTMKTSPISVVVQYFRYGHDVTPTWYIQNYGTIAVKDDYSKYRGPNGEIRIGLGDVVIKFPTGYITVVPYATFIDMKEM